LVRIEELPSGGDHGGVFERGGKDLDGVGVGEAVGVEEEGEIAGHDCEGLVVGGSESSISGVGDEFYLGVVLLEVCGGAIFAGVVDNDDFVNRLSFEGEEAGFDVVEGVIADDDNGDFGFVRGDFHLFDYGLCMNFQPKLKIRFVRGSRIGLRWQRR